MTRALAVAALVGCACGQSATTPTTTCPSSPAVPAVELSLCPADRPRPSLVVTEPPDDAALVRGSGFWCMAFVDGKLAGEGDCFRYQQACDEWRQRYRNRHKTTECRRAERASCVKVLDYVHHNMFYRCFPPDRCEASRAAMVARHPDLGFEACREMQ